MLAALCAWIPQIAPAAEIRALYFSNVRMRDGVRLAADVYLPGQEGRYPTIISRIPYDPRFKNEIEFARMMAEDGYAVVVNHCRGRYDSQGRFSPFKQEWKDGYDAVEWIVRQPWSNGKVAMIGASYSGMAAWQLAVSRHPNLKAIFALVAPADLYRDITYPGGAFCLQTNCWWFSLVDRRTVQDWRFNDWNESMKHLPELTIDRELGRSLPVLRDFMKHPAYGPYWRSHYSMDGRYGQVDVPCFLVGGWNDPLVRGVLDTYSGERRALQSGSGETSRVQALVGPWDHFGAITGQGTVYGDIDYGRTAAVDVWSLAHAWFDRWLKGKEPASWQRSPLRYFVTGINEWKDGADWPPAFSVEESWYLHSSGRANTSGGDGRLSRETPKSEREDTYTYDPQSPVPSLVSRHILTGSAVKDIQAIEKRKDVLVYTSDVLSEDLTVAGNPRLELTFKTDVRDTDFSAWLTEVLPDGRSMSLEDGIVRCSRYLRPRSSCGVLEPGKAYTVSVELGSLAHVFKSGNRVRVNVSSSSFPAFDRNLNTGGENWNETESKIAHQVVMHDDGHRSRLILPVSHSL